MLSTKELGTYGEKIAVDFLKEKRITPLFKNWSCTYGEIDIVCREDDRIVFVEVKTRYDSSFSRRYLFETIHRKKQKKLDALAQIFMKKHYYHRKWPDFRIDVVGVLVNKSDGSIVSVTHLKGAI
jgi:putative endonuclease